MRYGSLVKKGIEMKHDLEFARRWVASRGGDVALVRDGGGALGFRWKWSRLPPILDRLPQPYYTDGERKEFNNEQEAWDALANALAAMRDELGNGRT